MALSSETIGKFWASGRNVISTVVGLIGGVGLMSAAQSQGVMTALDQIYQGLTLIFSGATSLWNILLVAFPIIGGIMAKYASNSAKVDSQAAALKDAAKDPNTVVSKEATANLLAATAEAAPLAKPIEIKDKSLADAVPSDLVVAK